MAWWDDYADAGPPPADSRYSVTPTVYADGSVHTLSDVQGAQERLASESGDKWWDKYSDASQSKATPQPSQPSQPAPPVSRILSDPSGNNLIGGLEGADAFQIDPATGRADLVPKAVQVASNADLHDAMQETLPETPTTLREKIPELAKESQSAVEQTRQAITNLLSMHGGESEEWQNYAKTPGLGAPIVPTSGMQTDLRDSNEAYNFTKDIPLVPAALIGAAKHFGPFGMQLDVARNLAEKAFPALQKPLEGLDEGSNQLLSSLSTPKSLFTLGAIALLPETGAAKFVNTAISLGFSEQAGEGMWQEFQEARKHGVGTAEFWKHGTLAVGDGAMMTLAGLHGLHGVAKGVGAAKDAINQSLGRPISEERFHAELQRLHDDPNLSEAEYNKAYRELIANQFPQARPDPTSELWRQTPPAAKQDLGDVAAGISPEEVRSRQIEAELQQGLPTGPPVTARFKGVVGRESLSPEENAIRNKLQTQRAAAAEGPDQSLVDAIVEAHADGDQTRIDELNKQIEEQLGGTRDSRPTPGNTRPVNPPDLSQNETVGRPPPSSPGHAPATEGITFTVGEKTYTATDPVHIDEFNRAKATYDRRIKNAKDAARSDPRMGNSIRISAGHAFAADKKAIAAKIGETPPQAAKSGRSIGGPALVDDSGKVLVIGKIGDTHSDLLERAIGTPKEDAVIQSFLDDDKHVFLDDSGKPLNREEAGKVAHAASQQDEPIPLQSENLKPRPKTAKTGQPIQQTPPPAAAAAAPVPAPVNPHGIRQAAHDVRKPGLVQPGAGSSRAAVNAQGLADLHSGAFGGVNAILARGPDAGREMAMLDARHGQLQDVTDAADELARLQPTPENFAKAAAAYKAEVDFAKAIKPFQTDWSRGGIAQQRDANIANGTVRGMKRAVRETIGRDATKAEEPIIERTVEQVKRANREATEALSNGAEEVERRVQPKDRPKLTRDELRQRIADRYLEIAKKSGC